MKIRNRITLWITGAGLLAGLLFSIVISFELIEQPYELLDGELDSQAHTLLTGFTPQNDNLVPQADMAMLHSLGRLYWLKIFNKKQNVVYASTMTKFTELPLRKKYGGYNVHTTIPIEAASLEQDDSGEVTFRVRVFSIPLGDQEYLVQIARPMEKLQEEIYDLVLSITVGLIFFSLSLILFGYFAAGKILKPIAEINTLARDISEKTLDKRIPLGRNQDELYTLSSSLNQMFDRLQFSFQRQKEFIANAAHELKTPIAMQRLFFDEALQRDDLPGDFKARLSSQSEILFRLNRLVKNLLDLSTLELRETFALKKVDMTRLVSAVLSEFKEIIQTAKIQLVVDIEDSVFLHGDEEKLRRILINLIDNAIKYNYEENGEIQLSLRKKTEEVQVNIYNKGQGIPADELHKVFNQFYRVEKSRSTIFGGSGLGLTIVKRIVELHHGRIEIDSEFGTWVRVSIFLPMAHGTA
ncbi:MAG TPA: HAMP domain-containing histidine kinase [Desulfobulbaceae bacterium]|nr:HAMP domain-containing histidine kinase [Desulfobulbaceae bacterium]